MRSAAARAGIANFLLRAHVRAVQTPRISRCTFEQRKRSLTTVDDSAALLNFKLKTRKPPLWHSVEVPAGSPVLLVLDQNQSFDLVLKVNGVSLEQAGFNTYPSRTRVMSGFYGDDVLAGVSSRLYGEYSRASEQGSKVRRSVCTCFLYAPCWDQCVWQTTLFVQCNIRMGAFVKNKDITHVRMPV